MPGRRKQGLARLPRHAPAGIELNERTDCAVGLEGIVAKRLSESGFWSTILAAAKALCARTNRDIV